MPATATRSWIADRCGGHSSRLCVAHVHPMHCRPARMSGLDHRIRVSFFWIRVFGERHQTAASPRELRVRSGYGPRPQVRAKLISAARILTSETRARIARGKIVRKTRQHAAIREVCAGVGIGLWWTWLARGIVYWKSVVRGLVSGRPLRGSLMSSFSDPS